MPFADLLQRSFSAGEVTPALAARADHISYTAGLRICRNFIVGRSGGVVNRPGTHFITEVKNSAARTYLFRVAFGPDEQYVIEAGNLYFRFYTDGAQILDASADPYEVVTPYTTADLIRLQWSQTKDVITLTHPLYPPQELRRIAADDWTLDPVVFGPGITAPGYVSGVAGAAGTLTYSYQVTAVKLDPVEESLPSAAQAIAACALPTDDAPNVLSWDPVVDAVEYWVYCDPYGNGTFGYIGTATGQTSFKDPGLAPDFLLTPPQDRIVMASAGFYPACSASYQQRRLFGGSHAEAEKVYASRTGYPSNFSITSPLQDDDAVTFVLAGNDAQTIRHMLGYKRLLILTNTGEWIVRGDGERVLKPQAIGADQEAFAGASEFTRPVTIGNTVLYAQERGSAIRELRHVFKGDGSESFEGADLTILAFHLFEGYRIDRMDYAAVPFNVVWAARADGRLLGLTYVPEYEVFAWHQHTTGEGLHEVEDLAVNSEGYEDKVYLIVNRTLGGQTVRCIEQMATRVTLQDPPADAFFVDCGMTYDGTPQTVISGLDHLNGEVVAVLADGLVVYNGDPAGAAAATYTVTAGAITLPTAASVVHVGLRIPPPELELLDLDVQGTDLRARQKRIQGVALMVEGSADGLWIGPDASHLTQQRKASWEDTSRKRGIRRMNLTAGWTDRGRMVIRHTEPLPVHILGVIPYVEVGG